MHGMSTVGVVEVAFSLIPPITFQRGPQRWVAPALLEEEIVSMENDESSHEIYRVINPNLFTYPVHFHQGILRFDQRNANTPTMMLWNVQMRPHRNFLGYGLKIWTKTGMALASRNLRRYLEEKQSIEPTVGVSTKATKKLSHFTEAIENLPPFPVFSILKL
jgi:hypothetical protein